MKRYLLLMVLLSLPVLLIKSGTVMQPITIDNQVGEPINIQWYGNPSGELDVLPAGKNVLVTFFSKFVASYNVGVPLGSIGGIYVHSDWISVIPGTTYVVKKGATANSIMVDVVESETEL